MYRLTYGWRVNRLQTAEWPSIESCKTQAENIERGNIRWRKERSDKWWGSGEGHPSHRNEYIIEYMYDDRPTSESIITEYKGTIINERHRGNLIRYGQCFDVNELTFDDEGYIIVDSMDGSWPVDRNDNPLGLKSEKKGR
jgi:hypothetical protein